MKIHFYARKQTIAGQYSLGFYINQTQFQEICGDSGPFAIHFAYIDNLADPELSFGKSLELEDSNIVSPYQTIAFFKASGTLELFIHKLLELGSNGRWSDLHGRWVFSDKVFDEKPRSRIHIMRNIHSELTAVIKDCLGHLVFNQLSLVENLTSKQPLADHISEIHDEVYDASEGETTSDSNRVYVFRNLIKSSNSPDEGFTLLCPGPSVIFLTEGRSMVWKYMPHDPNLIYLAFGNKKKDLFHELHGSFSVNDSMLEYLRAQMRSFYHQLDDPNYPQPFEGENTLHDKVHKYLLSMTETFHPCKPR